MKAISLWFTKRWHHEPDTNEGAYASYFRVWLKLRPRSKRLESHRIGMRYQHGVPGT